VDSNGFDCPNNRGSWLQNNVLKSRVGLIFWLENRAERQFFRYDQLLPIGASTETGKITRRGSRLERGLLYAVVFTKVNDPVVD
jgi:hypothetical protein